MSSAKSKGTKRKGATAAGPKKPRKPRGMVELPAGTVLTDLFKNTWCLGPLVGWGGFGALYLASPNTGKTVDEAAEHVIKVEPQGNGPLFTELAFYQRVAKPDNIKSWMKSRKLSQLGVPAFLGQGLAEYSSVKLRFMVMERFSKDVDEIFLQHGRHFDIRTVLMLGLRIMDILEYIHTHEYCHADIKGSNLMLGFPPEKRDQVYLMDYGLAYRFCPNGEHKGYKEDPKRRHDGTIEFTSRDAHKGVAPSRRGDLEILGYVMLQWLCTRLPWEDNLTDKEYVKNQKLSYMDDIPKLMKECFGSKHPLEMQKYLEYVNPLEYEEEPDYDLIRKLFVDGLKKRAVKDDGKRVQFITDEREEAPCAVSAREKSTKRKSEADEETGSPQKKRRTANQENRKAAVSPEKRATKASPEKKPSRAAKKTTKTSPEKKPSRAVKKTTTANPDKKPSRAVKKTTKASPEKKPSGAVKRTTKASPEKKPSGAVKRTTKATGRNRKPVMVDTATSP